MGFIIPQKKLFYRLRSFKPNSWTYEREIGNFVCEGISTSNTDNISNL